MAYDVKKVVKFVWEDGERPISHVSPAFVTYVITKNYQSGKISEGEVRYRMQSLTDFIIHELRQKEE